MPTIIPNYFSFIQDEFASHNDNNNNNNKDLLWHIHVQFFGKFIKTSNFNFQEGYFENVSSIVLKVVFIAELLIQVNFKAPHVLLREPLWPFDQEC